MNGPVVKKVIAGSLVVLVTLSTLYYTWTTTKASQKSIASVTNAQRVIGVVELRTVLEFKMTISDSELVVPAPFNIYRVKQVSFGLDGPDDLNQHLFRVDFARLKRYLENGDFYYSENPQVYDVTKRLQRAKDEDDYYVANQRILERAQVKFGSKEGFTKLIKGLVVSEVIDGVHCLLISRHSAVRMGPRLQSRGTDSQGNASMTVETELLLHHNGNFVSFALIRGSIPFRWSQTRSWTKPIPTPVFSSDVQENAKMVRKHVDMLRRMYGEPVIGVSLVSFTGEEKPIGEMYVEVAKLVPNFKLHRFDYHAAVSEHKQKWGEKFVEPFRNDLLKIGFYSSKTGKRQHGVVRVNCLTVLDRTSVGQSQIMLHILDSLLHDLHTDSRAAVREWLKRAWIQTADAISMQIGGTKAQQSDVIEHGASTLGGKVNNAMVSLGRHWSSNREHDEQFEVMKMVHGYSD